MTAGSDLTARVNASGFIELTFGDHKGKALPDVPTSYLLTTFRDAWKDDTRRATAIQRLGAGFVAAVEAEIVRRGALDVPASIARLEERVAANEVLPDEEAERLREWRMDHPATSHA